MANTLKFPWIADYLIDVAQTYGGNLIGVPVHAKGKKVQLVKFLTYQASSADDCIWAKVSDKFNQIPVRFTAKALQEYEMLNLEDSQGKRLTAQRGAVVTIKQFKPVFRRIPVGENVQKMTRLETLALDVDSVSIIGSAHEPVFGSPQDLQCNESLQLWMEGLREPGGGGNVLKLRKEQQSPAEVADSGSVEPGRAIKAKALEPAIETFITTSRKGKEKAKEDIIPEPDEKEKFTWAPYIREPMFLRKRRNKMVFAQLDELSIENSTSNATSTEDLRRPYSIEGSLVSTPKRMWKSRFTFRMQTQGFYVPFTENGPLDISSSPVQTPSRSNVDVEEAGPTTPTEWQSSQVMQPVTNDSPSSPRYHSPVPSSSRSSSPPVSADGKSGIPADISTEPTLSAPTPAQRQRRVTPSSPIRPPSAHASAGLDSHRAASLPNLHRIELHKRRVAPPGTRMLPPNDKAGGRGMILVPNSDTSGTVSQPNTQSQPQVEAHSQGQDAPEAATSGTGDPPQAAPIVETHTRSQHDAEDEQTSSQLADVSRMAAKGTQPEDMDVDDAITHARLLPHLVKSAEPNSTSGSRLVLHSPSSLPVATYESVTARRASPVPDDDDDIPERRDIGRSRSPSIVEETVALPGSSLETNDASPSRHDERPTIPSLRAASKRAASASPSADESRSRKKIKLDTERRGPNRAEQDEAISDQEKGLDIVDGQKYASRKDNPGAELVSTFDETSIYPPLSTWRSEIVGRKLRFNPDWRLDSDKDPLPLFDLKELAGILGETLRLRSSAEPSF